MLPYRSLLFTKLCLLKSVVIRRLAFIGRFVNFLYHRGPNRKANILGSRRSVGLILLLRPTMVDENLPLCHSELVSESREMDPEMNSG